MSELGSLVMTVLASAVLGAVFFGGLWWTVQQSTASPVPARWFLSSLVLRTAIVLAGFYAIGAGQPLPLGLCLLGFLLARACVFRIMRPIAATRLSKEPPCP